jgi:hypothetical protein
MHHNLIDRVKHNINQIEFLSNEELNNILTQIYEDFILLQVLKTPFNENDYYQMLVYFYSVLERDNLHLTAQQSARIIQIVELLNLNGHLFDEILTQLVQLANKRNKT